MIFNSCRLISVNPSKDCSKYFKFLKVTAPPSHIPLQDFLILKRFCFNLASTPSTISVHYLKFRVFSLVHHFSRDWLRGYSFTHRKILNNCFISYSLMVHLTQSKSENWVPLWQRNMSQRNNTLPGNWKIFHIHSFLFYTVQKYELYTFGIKKILLASLEKSLHYFTCTFYLQRFISPLSPTWIRERMPSKIISWW